MNNSTLYGDKFLLFWVETYDNVAIENNQTPYTSYFRMKY